MTTCFLDTIVSLKLRQRYAATAHHEAGHAVTSHCAGRRLPRRVSILPEGSSLGRVHHRPWPSKSRPDIELSPRTRDLVENEIISLLAGPEAERRFTGRANRVGARADYEQASDLALYVGGDGEGASAYLAWCSFCARRAVASRWTAIERFAHKLLEKGELSGAFLKDALMEAFLPPGRTLEQEKALWEPMRARMARRGSQSNAKK